MLPKKVAMFLAIVAAFVGLLEGGSWIEEKYKLAKCRSKGKNHKTILFHINLKAKRIMITCFEK